MGKGSGNKKELELVGKSALELLGEKFPLTESALELVGERPKGIKLQNYGT